MIEKLSQYNEDEAKDKPDDKIGDENNDLDDDFFEDEKNKKIYKISEESPEYIKYLETARNFAMKDGKPAPSSFGETALKLRDPRVPKGVQKDSLDFSRKKIRGLLEDDETKKLAHSFFEEILGDKELKKNIRKQLGLLQSFGTHHIAREFNKIPDELFIKMLNVHVNNMHEKASKFEELEKILRQQFKQMIIEKIKSGIIPLDAEIAIKRIDEVTVHLKDALTAKFEKNLGSFSANENKINISDQLRPDILQETYVHEMLHALSGKTMVFLQYESGDEDVIHQRTGVVFNPAVTLSRPPKRRFNWLNEAITESLTLQLLNRPPDTDNSYEEEIELLQFLFSKGVSRQTVVNSYFENYDPEKKLTNRIPAWKELISTINEKFSPSFLVKLDEYIENNGTEEALEQLKKDWRAISQYK